MWIPKADLYLVPKKKKLIAITVFSFKSVIDYTEHLLHQESNWKVIDYFYITPLLKFVNGVSHNHIAARAFSFIFDVIGFQPQKLLPTRCRPRRNV